MSVVGNKSETQEAGLQPNVSKKPKPKRRAPWTDEEEEKLIGPFEKFGGDGFLYRVVIGQLVKCFGTCRCDEMRKITFTL